MNRPYPAPPHLVAGLVVNDMPAGIALGELKAAACAAGAHPAPAAWDDSDGAVLAAPDGGPLLLNVAFADDQASAGLELVISGELLGMPSWVSLEAEEYAAAERTREFVREALEVACDMLDPGYGGVDFEWRIPEPRSLMTNGARLPGDLYWSSRIDARDGALGPALEEIYGVRGVAFARGTLIPAGRVLDPAVPPPEQPLTAGRAAAKRLAEALRQAQMGETGAS